MAHQRFAVPCNTVPFPGVLLRAVIRCDFLFTQKSRYHAKYKILYQIPACTCVLVFFAFFVDYLSCRSSWYFVFLIFPFCRSERDTDDKRTPHHRATSSAHNAFGIAKSIFQPTQAVSSLPLSRFFFLLRGSSRQRRPPAEWMPCSTCVLYPWVVFPLN